MSFELKNVTRTDFFFPHRVPVEFSQSTWILQKVRECTYLLSRLFYSNDINILAFFLHVYSKYILGGKNHWYLFFFFFLTDHRHWYTLKFGRTTKFGNWKPWICFWNSPLTGCVSQSSDRSSNLTIYKVGIISTFMKLWRNYNFLALLWI